MKNQIKQITNKNEKLVPKTLSVNRNRRYSKNKGEIPNRDYSLPKLVNYSEHYNPDN